MRKAIVFAIALLSAVAAHAKTDIGTLQCDTFDSDFAEADDLKAAGYDLIGHVFNAAALRVLAGALSQQPTAPAPFGTVTIDLAQADRLIALTYLGQPDVMLRFYALDGCLMAAGTVPVALYYGALKAVGFAE